MSQWYNASPVQPCAVITMGYDCSAVNQDTYEIRIEITTVRLSAYNRHPHGWDNGDIQNLADAQSVILRISLVVLWMSFTSQYFIIEPGSNLFCPSFIVFDKCRYSLEINQTLQCLTAVDNQAVEKPSHTMHALGSLCAIYMERTTSDISVISIEIIIIYITARYWHC